MRVSRLLLLVLTVSLSVVFLRAQIHGVAPSVTSFGFGGNISPTPGVPASVTSLGPNGFDFVPAVNGPCCFNSFFPGHQYSSLPEDQVRSRFDFRSFRHREHFGPIFLPYAVPYTQVVAVPYAVGSDESDDDYVYDSSMFDRRPSRHIVSREANVEDAPAPAKEPSTLPSTAAVAAQPTTVLIFKDGHKLDVENYAIVGDTLFEFTNGLTHKFQLADLDLPATQKANDDRGVEFQAPSTGAQ